MATYHDKLLSEVPGLDAFAKDVNAQFADFLGDANPPHAQEQWQQSFELNTAMPGSVDNAITLIARGAKMPGAQEFLLVFDDVSEMVSAQRAQAWGEVARRLAHEIKNPLTPIQLSAERLKRRYLPQIEDEPETFQKCVETIIRQVEAIGRIILEFSSFARLPKASLAEVDLVPVVESVFCLYREAYPHIQWDYCAPPTLACWCDAQQIEQVVTNLLKNATESLHEKSVQARGHKGSVGVLLVAHNAFVTLEVSDNGCGLPSEMTRRFAEPYWTTKATGTGLGLAIVKKIAEDHGGELDLRASPEGGAVARVTLQSSPRQEQSPRGQTIQRQTI
jgi:nitrogen fixation/metabolism regulation signal transduction histidine kinase